MHARRCAAVAKGSGTSSFFFAASCAIPAGKASCPRHACVRVRMRCVPRCPTAKRIARRLYAAATAKGNTNNATQATARSRRRARQRDGRQQNRDNSAADDTHKAASSRPTWREERAGDNMKQINHAADNTPTANGSVSGGEADGNARRARGGAQADGVQRTTDNGATCLCSRQPTGHANRIGRGGAIMRGLAHRRVRKQPNTCDAREQRHHAGRHHAGRQRAAKKRAAETEQQQQSRRTCTRHAEWNGTH
jgi:hypothetical protein